MASEEQGRCYRCGLSFPLDWFATYDVRKDEGLCEECNDDVEARFGEAP